MGAKRFQRQADGTLREVDWRNCYVGKHRPGIAPTYALMWQALQSLAEGDRLVRRAEAIRCIQILSSPAPQSGGGFGGS